MSKKKQKKEKIIYYDDGSTIHDMSGVHRPGSAKPTQQKPTPSYISGPTFGSKSKWRTYWSAVRMMVVPLLVALGALAFIFLCALAIGQCASV